jgi:hypothetical protein
MRERRNLKHCIPHALQGKRPKYANRSTALIYADKKRFAFDGFHQRESVSISGIGCLDLGPLSGVEKTVPLICANQR